MSRAVKLKICFIIRLMLELEPLSYNFDDEFNSEPQNHTAKENKTIIIATKYTETKKRSPRIRMLYIIL